MALQLRRILNTGRSSARCERRARCPRPPRHAFHTQAVRAVSPGETCSRRALAERGRGIAEGLGVRRLVGHIHAATIQRHETLTPASTAWRPRRCQRSQHPLSQLPHHFGPQPRTRVSRNLVVRVAADSAAEVRRSGHWPSLVQLGASSEQFQGAAAGSTSTKQLPPPSRPWHSARPLWARAIWRTRASPRPTPPACSACPGRRKKGSKMRSRQASGTPGPRSQTRSSTVPGVGRASSTVAVPPP